MLQVIEGGAPNDGATMPDAPAANFHIITVDDIGDGERVSHKLVAVALGMSQLHKLRHLIERNIPEFERYGAVSSTVDGTTPKGGRPGTVYWLNEGQCLLAAIRSDAPRAPDVRHQIITAFMEYRRRQMQPASAGDMIHVREHERRASTRIDNALSLARSADRLEAVAARLEPPPPRVLSAFLIGDQPVVVDITDYRLGPGERAVVFHWDGGLAVHEVENREGQWARQGVGPAVRTKLGEERHACIIVGKVLEPPRPATQSAVSQEVRPALPAPLPEQYRGRRIKFRDEILRLLDEGMTNRDIARQTGATYQTVTHWRRWKADRASA